jgi:hypothetical protein
MGTVEQDIFLLIQLYFDGLAVTQGGSGSASLYNSGMFYFTLLNLPPECNADLRNIHLVAMCNYLDLKVGEGRGFYVVLRSIVDEIAEMETAGFQVQTEHGETFRVFGTLAQYTADSFVMNQILGLIASFSHDFFCVFCFTTREQMQNCFRKDDSQLRAYCDCEGDLELLTKNLA